EAPRAALALLYAYLRETYAPALRALQRVRLVEPGAHLHTDARTLRNLDVLPGGAGSLSLLRVLDRCRSAMGSRLLREWLVAPLRDPAAIGARLDAVAWA